MKYSFYITYHVTFYCEIVMYKMKMCFTAGPSAIRFMALQLCLCTVNGRVVRQRSKWEVGENRLENRPKKRDQRMGEEVEGERMRERKKENGQSATDEGTGAYVSVAQKYISNEEYGALCHPCTQIWG